MKNENFNLPKKKPVMRTSMGLLAVSLASTSLLISSTVFAEQQQKGAALEMLKQIKRNPELVRSPEARSDALLTTGSIVKSKGNDRVLYHLPSLEEGLRFAGERASKIWPVQVAREQLNGAVSLRLAYKNAVSVMPEASHLLVEVNGIKVGQQPIQSATMSKTLFFNVPPHILVPGYNELRVTARQRHRVDCSIQATHELWTDIDPSKSGLVFDQGNSVLNTLEGIAAVARNKGGQVKIRILAPHVNNATQVQQSMLLAQHTAIYSHFHNAEVDVAADRGKGAGIDVFAGTRAELAQAVPAYANVVRNDQALQILSRDGDERIALILITDSLSHQGHEGFANHLKSLFPKREKSGSSAGVRAARSLKKYDFSKGKKIALRDFGVVGDHFNGRLYRHRFPINLPSDYYSADYNQAELRLVTAYAAGLKKDNKFLVRVNGNSITGFSIGKADGQIYKNKMLRLPLSAFKPGVNWVDIEVQLAKQTDDVCDPRKQIRDDKRFVLSGDSTIQFPHLAHLARLPDLAGTVSSAFPYVIAQEAKPTVISVPNPTYHNLSAAAAFSMQLAIKGKVPLRFSLAYQEPENNVKNAIIIGGYQSVPASLAKNIKGIDTQAFDTAWFTDEYFQPQYQTAHVQHNKEQGNHALDSGNIDPLTTAGVQQNQGFKVSNVTAQPRPMRAEKSRRQDSFQQWQAEDNRTKRNDENGIGFVNQVSALVGAVLGSDEKKIEKNSIITDPNVDILMSQTIAPNNEHGVWTVLTARNDESLKRGVALLNNAHIASQISGETITINGIDKRVTSSITAQKYIQVRQFSLRNSHLIVAGWFSNNHILYGLLLLCGIVLGGITSSRLVKMLGVQQNDEQVTSAAVDAANAPSMGHVMNEGKQ